MTTAERFAALWGELLPVGRATGGGYVRYAYGEAELDCREWFRAQAAARGLDVREDGNGNLFAWWGTPGQPAVVTGSHFDSVPHGGAYDGPLGIVSAFLAVDVLREKGIEPRRPVVVAAFAEEEGSRFGVACLGSRLLTGAIEPARAVALTDRDGITLGEAMRRAGLDPGGVGPAPLDTVGCYVELHVEQGRALDVPVGVASAIWPHGRWRLDFGGEGNHAGTTRMADRRDPMLTFAHTVLAADERARLADAVATIGRVEVAPGATNAIAAEVRAWLDARAPDEAALTALVESIAATAKDRAARDGTTVAVTAESTSPVVDFDLGLRDRISRLLGAPVLPTGAGHDAGVLAARVPTAMLFVRNPTGVSHSPAEYATDADCAAGVTALAQVLEELACR